MAANYETDKIVRESELVTEIYPSAIPSFTLPVRSGFMRKWFATSTELRPSQGSQQTQWGIHWYTPASVILMLVLGIASATGHHVFYNMLDGTAAGDEGEQRWVTWIGTGLAFFTNAALASVLGISRTQWLWLTLRRKFLTLGGIDAIFGVTSDPLFFTNRDMLRQAKLATFMAILIWISPLTSMLTPSTIPVKTVIRVSTVPCTVRTLVFEFDPGSTAEKLCCNNLKSNVTTTGLAKYAESGEVVREFITTRILRLTAFSGLIPGPSDLRPDAVNSTQALKPIHDPETSLAHLCEHNCTYVVTFLAPAIKCTEVKFWNTTEVPWNDPQQFMQGNRYHAELQTPQETLWVGYYPGVLGLETQEPIVQICQSSVARYTVRLDLQVYRFGAPIIEAVETLYLVPVTQMVFPNTTYLPNQALFGLLHSLLVGKITATGVRQSDVILTTLFSAGIVVPSDLGSAIETMAQRMIVSLLSVDTDGTTLTHPLLQYGAREQTQCTKSRYLAVYNYQAWILVSVYGTAAATALCIAVLGFMALERNGVASTSNISVILRTTRNPTLDRLMDSGLGGELMSEELENLKLKFGELKAQGETAGEKESGNNGAGVRRVAIGIEGEVSPIRRGERYR